MSLIGELVDSAPDLGPAIVVGTGSPPHVISAYFAGRSKEFGGWIECNCGTWRGVADGPTGFQAHRRAMGLKAHGPAHGGRRRVRLVQGPRRRSVASLVVEEY